MYLTIEQVAQALGYKTIAGVRMAVYRGELIPAGRGARNSYLFTPDAVDAFVRARGERQEGRSGEVSDPDQPNRSQDGQEGKPEVNDRGNQRRRRIGLRTTPRRGGSHNIQTTADALSAIRGLLAGTKRTKRHNAA